MNPRSVSVMVTLIWPRPQGCFQKGGETLESLVAEQPRRFARHIFRGVRKPPCLLYIERGVTSAPLDPTACSPDWLWSSWRNSDVAGAGMRNHVCLVRCAGGHRVLRRDGDSSRQPEPVRQHRRPAGVREGSPPADGLQDDDFLGHRHRQVASFSPWMEAGASTRVRPLNSFCFQTEKRPS